MGRGRVALSGQWESRRALVVFLVLVFLGSRFGDGCGFVARTPGPSPALCKAAWAWLGRSSAMYWVGQHVVGARVRVCGGLVGALYGWWT